MSSDREDEITLQVISERLKSLRDLSETGFINIQRQLDDVRDLPIRVEKLSGRVDAVEQRIGDIEDVGTRGSEWRRASLPIILLTLALVVVGVATILAQIR